MSAKAKRFWTWFVGITGSVLVPLLPYIQQLSAPPREAYGAAIVNLLFALGLIQSKRPQDHEDTK